MADGLPGKVLFLRSLIIPKGEHAEEIQFTVICTGCENQHSRYSHQQSTQTVLMLMTVAFNSSPMSSESHLDTGWM